MLPTLTMLPTATVMEPSSHRAITSIIAMLAAAAAWGQQFEELGRKALEAAQAGRYQEAIAPMSRCSRSILATRAYATTGARAEPPRPEPREPAALGKPADADGLALAGLNYRALGDLASAERDLRADSHCAGTAARRRFRHRAARSEKREEAEKVFSRYPDEVAAWWASGLPRIPPERMRRQRRALPHGRREPAAADIRAELGDVFFTTDRLPEADAAYRGSHPARCEQSGVSRQSGTQLIAPRPGDCGAEKFREAVRLDPLNSEAHFELGRIAAAARDDEVAQMHLEASAAIDPGRGAAHYQLGLLYRRFGDPVLAKASMRRFEQLRNQDRPYRIDMAQPTLVIEGPFQSPAIHRIADGRLSVLVQGTPAGPGAFRRRLRLARGQWRCRRRLEQAERRDAAQASAGNGMLVLSSGRPGVDLRISKSGAGRRLVGAGRCTAAHVGQPRRDYCGRVGLVALDHDTFLIVYHGYVSRTPTVPTESNYGPPNTFTPRVASNRGATPPPAAASSRRALSTRLMKGDAYPAVVEAVRLRRWFNCGSDMAVRVIAASSSLVSSTPSCRGAYSTRTRVYQIHHWGCPRPWTRALHR